MISAVDVWRKKANENIPREKLEKLLSNENFDSWKKSSDCPLLYHDGSSRLCAVEEIYGKTDFKPKCKPECSNIYSCGYVSMLSPYSIRAIVALLEEKKEVIKRVYEKKTQHLLRILDNNIFEIEPENL